MGAVIRLNKVRYRYPTTEWILDGVDLSIQDGEYTAICGRNGSGKSTIGYLFNGLIPHFFGGTFQGSVEVDDIDTRSCNTADLFSRVGFVHQNGDAQLFNNTVEDEIAFGLESLGLPGKAVNEKIIEISEKFNISSLLDRSPSTLSGGEKRLVAIASVLCLNPSALILDEPYANLDWEVTKRVRGVLSDIHRSGKNVIVIEQRMNGLLHDTTRCLVADKGKILYDGSPEAGREIFLQQHLIPKYPKRKKQAFKEKGAALEVRNLSYGVEKKEILKNISIELSKGETVAIIGKNGSGKTTLIKHFNGLLKPNNGDVILQGKNIKGIHPSQLANKAGFCFQNPNDQFFKNNVKDEILIGLKMIKQDNENWFEEICDLFDLHDLLEKSPYRLSEGEKKRVSISSVLTMRPNVVVLDEPTVGQDGYFRETLVVFLAALEARGFTNIIVTHDLDFAKACASRWIVLHEGNVVGDGPPEDLLSDERLIHLGALHSSENEEASSNLFRDYVH